MTINLYKNKDLDADYFTTLNNELNSMLEEYNIINPVFEQLTQLKTYFETTLSSKPALAKLDNTYLEMQLEAMNAYLGLTDDFKEFVDLPTAVYPLIDETLTVNSVALQGYINSENCTTYDVKVGDVISLDFALFNFEESSDAHLRGCLFFDRQRFDRSRRADFGADTAFIVTVTVDVGQTRLQHKIKPVFQPCRTQHLTGATNHANLASRTFIFESLQTDGTRRGERRPIRDLFGMFVSFSSLPSPSLGQSRYGGQRSGYGCAGCEKGASAVGIAGRFRLYLRWFTR